MFISMPEMCCSFSPYNSLGGVSVTRKWIKIQRCLTFLLFLSREIAAAPSKRPSVAEMLRPASSRLLRRLNLHSLTVLGCRAIKDDRKMEWIQQVGQLRRLSVIQLRMETTMQIWIHSVIQRTPLAVWADVLWQVSHAQLSLHKVSLTQLAGLTP